MINFRKGSRIFNQCELRKRNYHLILLSGDRKETVKALGKKLGFNDEDIFYEMDPEKKLMAITKTQNSMMVGDGVNDSLAMLKASVSVSTSGGVEAALKSSDAYLTASSLRGILDFFSRFFFGIHISGNEEKIITYTM